MPAAPIVVACRRAWRPRARVLCAACSTCLLVCMAMAGDATGATYGTIASTLNPGRLGARGSLTLDTSFFGGESGIPAPVRATTLQLPAGLALDIPHLQSCSLARLRDRGAAGCPSRSRIGTGQALVEVLAGSLRLSERVTLSLFMGVPRNLSPTFEVLGQGYTPVDERLVFTGSALPDAAPYGEQLVLDMPVIPTLALEPNVSIVSLSLRIGEAPRPGRAAPTSVVAPSSCPAGGFPFAAQFAFEDGSSSDATYSMPCPRQGPAPPSKRN